MFKIEILAMRMFDIIGNVTGLIYELIEAATAC